MQLFTSQQRQTGETASDFHNIFNPPKRIYGKSLKFKSLNMTDSTFNVGSWNLYIDATSIAMIPGNYNITSIASMLSNQINASLGAGSCTVVGNTATSLLTFTFIAPHAINFQADSGKLWKVIGFSTADGLSSVNVAAALIITSPYTVNLAITTSFYINMEVDGYTNSNSIDIGTNHMNCSFVVPNYSLPGGVFKLTESDIDFIFTPLNDVIRSVRFTVKDQDGSLVDLHNVDWWILFKFI